MGKRKLMNGRSRGAALIGVASLVMLSGCYSPGGPRWSADRYTYESTTWSPKTVFVVDTRTGQTIWSIDVPVGKQVAVGFESDNGPNAYMPDTMVWEVMDYDRKFGTLSNRRAAPPAHARRIEFELRPSPEYVETQEILDSRVE